MIASAAQAAPGRSIRIVADDDSLAGALREQRLLAAGWRIGPLEQPDDIPLDPDALVIVDLDDAEAQHRAVGKVRATGFAGSILILGGDLDTSPAGEAIARPVRLGVLLARIGAHGRFDQSAAVAALGPYELDAAEYALRDASSGRLVRLTELELKLLTYLIAAAGGLVDREELLQHVWGYRAGADTHTVETHIWRLRQKVETEDPATRFVVTETGGYRLVLASRERAG